jgi:hypothetical protein
MRNRRLKKLIFLTLIAFIATFGWNTAGWSHGDKIQIVPEKLNVRSGDNLQVKVMGLMGTKTATFNLTGLSGKYDLGQFDISSDDFTQVIEIPADLPAGSYRLTVEGGGNSAKVVITIN